MPYLCGMHSIAELSTLIEGGIFNAGFPQQPTGLYDPARYILYVGGKSIRQLLAIMGAQVFADDVKPHLPVALAMEVFHNFTLVHDDIMDNAPLRRGKQTVHEKWDVHTAILSGDAMMIQSYVLLAGGPSNALMPLLDMFNKTALAVCEGQQDDMDFEKSEEVEIDAYLEMIAKKTSVLLGCSLYCGAISAGANEDQAALLYEAGLKLGISFQIQDDILDTYGDSSFGKQTGGDIARNKKTILFLMARDLANETDCALLLRLYHDSASSESEKIAAVRNIFDKYAVKEHAESLMARYYEESRAALSSLHSTKNGVDPLLKLFDQVFTRTT